LQLAPISNTMVGFSNLVKLNLTVVTLNDNLRRYGPYWHFTAW